MTPFDTCSLCPRLCRSACPVATGSGREIAAPSWIGHVLRAYRLGRVDRDEALAVATLCADCGGCADLCHLHVPLPQLLREVRAELGAGGVLGPLAAIEGSAAVIVVETDDRPLAAALAARSGREVSRWPAPDRLGVDGIESPGWSERAAALRERVGPREVVVADGGAAAALGAAGIAYRWAWDWLGVPAPPVGSCATGGDRPLRCCGAAGPLARFHPDDAARVARMFAERAVPGVFADVRCSAHLRRSGAAVRDWVDGVIDGVPDGAHAEEA